MEGFKQNLLKEKKDAIQKRGLADKTANPVNLNYEQYQTEKRKTLLYLGNKAMSELQRPQEPPSGLISTIPQKCEKVKRKTGGNNERF